MSAAPRSLCATRPTRTELEVSQVAFLDKDVGNDQRRCERGAEIKSAAHCCDQNGGSAIVGRGPLRVMVLVIEIEPPVGEPSIPGPPAPGVELQTSQPQLSAGQVRDAYVRPERGTQRNHAWLGRRAFGSCASLVQRFQRSNHMEPASTAAFIGRN
jgi:hypothetical protein